MCVRLVRTKEMKRISVNCLMHEYAYAFNFAVRFQIKYLSMTKMAMNIKQKDMTGELEFILLLLLLLFFILRK